MLNIVCIIQARMGSTRLPGKVGMDIEGKPMLQHVVERARGIQGVNEVIVATTESVVDDAIIALCRSIDVPWFRGSENDVLDRYFKAATLHDADAIVRVTSDCPLLDPVISGHTVERFSHEGPDYASNALERKWPRGLDTEITTMAALTTAFHDAIEALDREHVTRYIWRQPDKFRLLSVPGEHDYAQYRWTVDTAEDLKLVRLIYRSLGNSVFSTFDIIELLNSRPDWASINAHIEQKAV